MAQRVSMQHVEKNIALQRVVEQQRRDLTEFASENAKLLSAARAQAQIENRRRATQQQICRTEAEYEERVKRDDYQRRLHNRTLQQNQDLVTELDKQESEHERKAREIQRICDEAPELKEFGAVNVAPPLNVTFRILLHGSDTVPLATLKVVFAVKLFDSIALMAD